MFQAIAIVRFNVKREESDLQTCPYTHMLGICHQDNSRRDKRRRLGSLDRCLVAQNTVSSVASEVQL